MQKNFQPIIWALALAILLLVGALIVYLPVLISLKKVGNTMLTLVEKTRSKFSPVVRIDQTLVYQDQSPVLELTTHKQHLEHEMQWSSTWAGSTKTVTLKGHFIGHGGFDLAEPITVDFDTKTKVVRIVHPAPRLMALELRDLKTSQEDGWWHKVSDENRNAAIREFKNEARQRLEKESPLLENAVKDLRAQLSTILKESGYRVEFQQREATAPSATPVP